MARGKQLHELVAQLRAETGRTQDVSIGTDEVENLKNLLRRTQEVLYDEYDWPFLMVERSMTLNNGQRYYDFPTDVNYDRLKSVKYKYGNVYTDIERGITFDDFSIFDSNIDERSSPLLKWDVRNTGSGEQMEVWPIPNQTGSVHFFGVKTLANLTQDSDRADLDDRLIVLFAAAEMLARQKSRDAQAKAQQADKRLLKLRANSQSSSRTVRLGQRSTPPTHTRGTQIIVS
jgi:hypothetical protein